MTTTEVIPYAQEALSARMEYARTLASASLIPKALWTPNRNDSEGRLIPSEPSPGNVLLVMEHGAMLDLHPMAAINGIFIIEGKASMSANLMAAVVRARGFQLRISTEGEWGESFKATATLIRPDDPEFTYRVEWTKAKAERAELTGKDNWRKYPEAMAKARAISEVIREGASDALNGIGYTPEELGASVDEGGNVIDGELVDDAPQVATPSAKPAPRKRATNGTQGTRRKAAEPDPEPEAEQPAEDPNIIDAEEVTEPEPTPEVKPDDESDPDKIDRDNEVAVARYNETHGKVTGNYLTSNAELAERQAELDGQAEAARKAEVAANVAAAKEEGARKRAEREAAEEREMREADAKAQEEVARLAEETHANTATGEVPDDDGDAVAERIKAERAARGARTTMPKEEAQALVQSVEEPWSDPFEDEPDYDAITAAEPEEYEKRARAAATVDQLKEVYTQAGKAGKMPTELRALIIDLKAALEAASA